MEGFNYFKNSPFSPEAKGFGCFKNGKLDGKYIWLSDNNTNSICDY